MTRSISVLIGAAVMCLAASAAQAQTKYPLVCRGGGSNLTLTYTPVPSRPVSEVRLSFQRGPGGGSGNLQPGQCAWQDRAVAPSEPALICVKNVRVNVGFVLGRDRQPHVSGANASNPDANNLLTMIGSSGDHWFTFMVFNDFAGCLRTN